MVVRRRSRAPGIQGRRSGTYNHAYGRGRAHETRLRACRAGVSRMPTNPSGLIAATTNRLRARSGSPPSHRLRFEEKQRLGSRPRDSCACAGCHAPAAPLYPPMLARMRTRGTGGAIVRQARSCSPMGAFCGWSEAIATRRPACPGSISPPRRIAPTLLHCVKLRHAEDLYTQPELRQ